MATSVLPTRRRTHCGRDALVCLTLLAVVQIPGRGHDVDNTHLQVTIADGRVVIDITNDPDWLWRMLAGDESQPPSPADRDRDLTAAAARFGDQLRLEIDDRPMALAGATYLPPSRHDPSLPVELAEPGVFRLEGVLPAGAEQLRLTYHLATGQYPMTLAVDDAAPVTRWLIPGERSRPFDLTRPRPMTTRQVAGQYLQLGFVHILPRGLDHILFVLGLFLLSTRLKPLVVQVSAFTLAHTMTLGLTMYGVVALSPAVVEPLIALSIVYVGVENLLIRDLRPWRVALVFAFGLLHGMGFAGVLADLELPRAEVIPALLSFNLGVETGQLSVIALAFAVVAGVRQRDHYRRRVVVPASLAIAGTGLVWTVQRVAAGLG